MLNIEALKSTSGAAGAMITTLARERKRKRGVLEWWNMWSIKIRRNKLQVALRYGFVWN